MNYAAASPRVPAIEDWYNFEEEEDYEFHDALDSHEPDANAEHKDKATLTKDDDDWLSEEIQKEVRKLEQLAKQLDEVVTPAIQAKPGPLELNTQQIKEFTEERKPLELESAKESMENSTEVASILIPTKAVPNIIPPKHHHLFEIGAGVCAKSEGANATSEGAECGGTTVVRARVC